MYYTVTSHNVSVQTSLCKHPNKKVKLKMSAIISVLLKQSLLAHPFSCMFQIHGALFQLGTKGHLQSLHCPWNMNSSSCGGAGAAWLGLLLRMLQQLFLYILWGFRGAWRPQSGLEAHIHIAKVMLGLQSHRTEALDLI